MVIVFGSINLDLIFAVPRLPESGETVLGPELAIQPGGKGANQALAAARDGARVIFAGAIGADPFAEPALAGLAKAAVDVSRIAVVPGATGAAAITVDPDGRNQIAVAAGANRFARAAQIEDALLTPEVTLLLQMESEPAEVAALIRRARAASARVILNLAPPLELDSDVLAMLDLLLLNEREAATLATRLGGKPDPRSLSDRLGLGVVRTLGAAGIEATVDGEEFRVPAHPVRVIDTTAAGDCFAGVLAAALDRGRSVEEALRRAVIAAGLACARAGSQASLPTAAEIDAACPHPNPSPE
ncbi:MAG: ribokinase [Acetobacteraceae bacterium]